MAKARKKKSKVQALSTACQLRWDGAEPNGRELEQMLTWQFGGIFFQHDRVCDEAYSPEFSKEEHQDRNIIVPCVYWTALVALDWIIMLHRHIYTCISADMDHNDRLSKLNMNIRILLYYHFRACTLILEEARALGGDKDSELPTLQEWMCRTAWGVHSVTDKKSPEWRQAMAHTSKYLKSEKAIGQ